MTLLRCVTFLPLGVALVLGQTPDQSKPARLQMQPQALVRNLYADVVARHPHDIPKGADWEIFAPYLSKGLLQGIDLARACAADRDRKSSDPELTARIVSEYGLFSGEEGAPQAFQIQKTEGEKDASVRVYVSLTLDKPPQRPLTWRVAAVVLREDGRFVIDDVIYLDDAVYDREEDRKNKRMSAYLSAGCDGPRWVGDTLPNQPEALIRSLYAQVVARRPVGIPAGEDWKVFAPYLSKTLLHRIDLALACGADWYRQYPDPHLKPEIGSLELGIFSGGDDEGELRAFHIERTQSEEDKSFRVYVGLIWGFSPESPWTSHVTTIVHLENSHYVVDDVIYLNDQTQDVESRLTESLSAGCDGPRWVGFGDQRNNLK